MLWKIRALFLVTTLFLQTTGLKDENGHHHNWFKYYEWCNQARVKKLTDFHCYCPARTQDLFYYFDHLPANAGPKTIEYYWVCDAFDDCPTGKDEKDCFCNANEYQCGCPLRTRHCYYGQGCYTEEDICDGRLDCLDGTDELNCSCPSGQFKCTCEENNTCGYPEVCILEAQTCDGRRDCSGGSDEENCPCGPESFACGCQYIQGKCVNITECIPISSKCDGQKDCADGRDEQNCELARIKFYCACAKEGNCVPPYKTYVPWENVCNQKNDCGDWSDERNCPCHQSDFVCDCNVEGCRNSSGCVNAKKFVCDGVNDCGDWSDEVGCTYDYPIFNCDCFVKNQTCRGKIANVNRKYVCDGYYDCSDRSDEVNCTCSGKHFQCKCADSGSDKCLGDSWCISRNMVCDGYKDCSDASDEINCDWPDDLFVCACAPNNSCPGTNLAVASRFECDGSNTCGDWSDEEGCNCDRKEFQCACYSNSPITCSGKLGCIDKDKRCNYLNDCGDWSDEVNCTFFRCACSSSPTLDDCFAENVYAGKRCDLKNDCGDWSDENNCTCPPDTFECPCNAKGCGHAPGCINDTLLCNGINDCGDWSDEYGCQCPSGNVPCSCYASATKTCAGTHGCILNSKVCNSKEDCLDKSDERGCNCTAGQLRCGCLYNESKCSSASRCIHRDMINDGVVDCQDGEDEPCQVSKYVCSEFCNTTTIICRDEAAKSKMLKYENPDKLRCFPVLTKTFQNFTIGTKSPHWACATTNCNLEDCQQIVLCDNNAIVISRLFCNGNNNCYDTSDETTNVPGFKCPTKYSPFRCNMPQSNLYDDIQQCSDGSDLCFANDTMRCFQCFDKKLIISPKQVCDGVADCFDLSDECMCANQSTCTEVLGQSKSLCPDGQLYCSKDKGCMNSSKILCNSNVKCSNDSNNARCTLDLQTHETKTCISTPGIIEAKMCDGRTECRDMSDECNCPGNKPWACDSPCRWFYPLGDRFCDGQSDIAYDYIGNETLCPKGFDEKNCSKRFYCTNGAGLSIDVNEVCDGSVNCEDGSDEEKSRCSGTRFYCLHGKPLSVPMSEVEDGKWDCSQGSDECPPQSKRKTIFSSQYELIGNKAILAMFWIMALLSLFGNFFVFLSTARRILLSAKASIALQYNSLFVLNLSVSDFLMGVYLLCICVKSAQFSGNYCFHDLQWRTGSGCTFLGVLVVVSTETSVFIMTGMTTFRFATVYRPFITQTLTLKWGKVAVVSAWLLAILLATIPIFPYNSGYFTSAVWYPNYFYKSDQVKKEDIVTLAQRMGMKTNSTWSDTKAFIDAKLPYLPLYDDVGYYGETSVCMPRLFVRVGDAGWPFSSFLITLNFLLFLYIVLGYVMIFIHGTRNQGIKRSNKHARKMQSRITRLILTDFACWVPLCTLAFIQLSGHDLSSIVYAVSAGILLPTNSAINPLIYSDTITGFVADMIRCRFSYYRHGCVKVKRENSSFASSSVQSTRI